jgi:hypothetical protein
MLVLYDAGPSPITEKRDVRVVHLPSYPTKAQEALIPAAPFKHNIITKQV